MVTKGGLCIQRKQNLLLKPLIIHISAGLGIPLGGALFRTEEEIIHVEYIAVVCLLQNRCQSCFTGCTVTVNGDQDLSAGLKQSIDA